MKEKTIYGQTKKRKKIEFGKLEEKKKRTFFRQNARFRKAQALYLWLIFHHNYNY